MAAGLSDFDDYLKQGLENMGPFRPKPYYEPTGDSVIFYIRDVQSYAKRLNPILTLFLSADDESLVGCEVKGVKRLLRTYGDFMVSVTEHRGEKLRLGMLLGFGLALTHDENLRRELEPYKDVEIDSDELQLA